MKKFAIMTPILFAPPNPIKIAGFTAAASSIPSFSTFFSSYFGSVNYNSSNTACGRMMAGM